MTRSAMILALVVTAACASPAVTPPAATDDPRPRPTPTAATARPSPTSAAAPTAAPSPATIVPIADGTARPAWAAQLSGALYFRRGDALWRVSAAGGTPVKLFERIGDFAADGSGRRIAVVSIGRPRPSAQAVDDTPDVWIVNVSAPDDATRVTSDGRVELGLTWSSAGALAFAAVDLVAFDPARVNVPAGRAWADICRAATVEIWSGALGRRAIGPGCDPAWSPDGTQLAFASPPEVAATPSDPQPQVNAIRVVDAQGRGATDVIRIGGPRPAPFGTDPTWPGRYLVRPTWLDDSLIVYGRFLGYATLCDHLTVERTAIGGGTPVLFSAVDWMQRGARSPSGRFFAVDTPACGAAGFGGYNARGLDLLDLTLAGTAWDPPIFGSPPSFLVPAAARSVLSGVRAHSPAWSPTGDVLAYVYPPNFPGSREVTPERTSRYNGTDPGDVIIRDIGRGEAFRLVVGVDFGSPLVWARQ